MQEAGNKKTCLLLPVAIISCAYSMLLYVLSIVEAH